MEKLESEKQIEQIKNVKQAERIKKLERKVLELSDTNGKIIFKNANDTNV